MVSGRGRLDQSQYAAIPADTVGKPVRAHYALMVIIAVLSALALVQLPPDGAVNEGHERRGNVIARLDGLPAESWQACASACSLNHACAAWTWRVGHTQHPARCEHHASALTPRRHPGAITGLSSRLATQIEAASDRLPDAREREALRALGPAEPARSTLPSEFGEIDPN